MSENKSISNEAGKKFKGYFDGVKFLWDNPETRFFLKLLIILSGLSIAYYTILNFLMASNNIPLLSLIVIIFDPIILGIYVYIILELILFYLNERKNGQVTEKKKRHTNFTKSNLLLLIGCILITYLVRLVTFNFVVLMIFFLFIGMAIMIIMGYISIKAAMESFEEKFSDKFHKESRWFFIFFPISWIFFITLTIILSFREIISQSSVSSLLLFQFYSFIFSWLAFLSLLSLIIKKWRAAFTITQISLTLTFIIIVLIPFFIDLAIEILGIIASFCAMSFFFIQGILDERGDELREYLTKPHDNVVPNAYLSAIRGLIYLTITLFAIIYNLGYVFTILSMQESMEMVSLCLFLIGAMQLTGMGIATVWFTIKIMRRQIKKEREVENLKTMT